MKRFPLLLLLTATLCISETTFANEPVTPVTVTPDNKKITTESGLSYQILERTKKDGKQAMKGATVKVHYKGTLLDGTEFDQSYKRGKPFEFELGKGSVIKGWDEGIAYLKEGDKARFWIPANLAYGATARPTIPANSELIFDVELIEVILPPQPWDVSKLKGNTTASGLTVYKLNTTKGQQAQAGDKVRVHYSGYLTDGSMFDSSVKRGQPFDFDLGKGSVIKGWDEGIALLRVGEKARLSIPADLAYGATDRPGIPANSVLNFDVELVAIVEVPKPWDIGNIKPETTASGLKVYRYNKTEGATPKTGQTVNVHYSGYLADGKLFDSSVQRGQPLPFPLGQGRVIKGWDEGVALLRVGEKAKLVIPSNLAYGDKGVGNGLIPPNSELIFDVELMSID